MVPALCVLKTVGKVEVQQANRVDWIEMEVPVSSTLCLFSDGERRIIDGAVFEELLVYVLHLHDEFLSLVILAIYVEDGSAGIHTVTKLFGVEISYVLHVLFAM